MSKKKKKARKQGTGDKFIFRVPPEAFETYGGLQDYIASMQNYVRVKMAARFVELLNEEPL